MIGARLFSVRINGAVELPVQPEATACSSISPLMSSVFISESSCECTVAWIGDHRIESIWRQSSKDQWEGSFVISQWKTVHSGMGCCHGEPISADGRIGQGPGQDMDEMGIELGSGCHPKDSERNVSAYVVAKDMGDFYGVEGVGDR